MGTAYDLLALHANDILAETGGEMTDVGLCEVLARGDKAREVYYAACVDEMPMEDIQIIAQVFSARAVGDTIPKTEMITALRAVYSHKDAEKMFQDLLHRGVIARTEGGQYQSPIPSFRSWIVEKFRTGTS